MRTNITERFYRTFTYQDVDRVPDIEDGFWPQTIRRWLKEGLDLELTPEETGQKTSPKLDAYFGFEPEGWPLPINMRMNPPFEEQIIEEKTSSIVMRDGNGIVSESFPSTVDESSIPHYLDFPVKTPEDWGRMKTRYRIDDPERTVPEEIIEAARNHRDSGKAIHVRTIGFYGQLRWWMGMENLSFAFYDYPDMVHDMVDHWSRMAAMQIASLPEDIPIDIVDWWEDMASRNGPLVSPALFRRFLQPGYHRVMAEARKRGCVLSVVDCDGNPFQIVGNWLEEGINIMFPLEAAAGVDPLAWRERFGMDLRLRGGIAKRALVEGGSAIDRELERIRPVFEQGGYIPHLDHLVPPDIPYDHYCDYLEKKRRLIGK